MSYINKTNSNSIQFNQQNLKDEFQESLTPELPLELIQHIFSFLSPVPYLGRMSLVCRHWYKGSLDSWNKVNLYKLFPFPAFKDSSSETVTLPLSEISLPTNDKRAIIRTQTCFERFLSNTLNKYQISVAHIREEFLRPSHISFKELTKISLNRCLKELNILPIKIKRSHSLKCTILLQHLFKKNVRHLDFKESLVRPIYTCLLLI